MIDLFLIDDHRLFRSSIIRLLTGRDDMRVVGDESGENFKIVQFQKHTPEVVLCDLEMPGKNGLDICQQIKTSYPEIKILILTQHLSKEYIQKATSLGLEGYLHKDITFEELLEAISSLSQGEYYFPSKVATSALASAPSLADYQLSNREMEVLLMMTQGKKSREIADKLFISVKTVCKHRANILNKFQVRNTAALINTVYSNHLLS